MTHENSKGSRTDSLVEAVTALASARSLQELTAQLRRSACELTGAEGVSFVLREEGMCHYVEEATPEPLWLGRRFPLEACICGWTMMHRQIAAIPDIYADARIPHDVYRSTFVKSLVAVPLLLDDAIGAIVAYWAEHHEATQDELDALQALANAAAPALHNVRLNADLERALKAERESRQRAEDANQLKDDFLSTLSHELRSPLQVIQSWLWRLGRSATSEESRKAVQIIERNTALQSRLVEDLLDMSRSSSGKLRIQVQLVNLAAMCAEVMEVLQPSARTKNIRLELHRGRTPYIWADPDRIQQILWNVLNNALKFTPQDGRITVRIKREARRVCVSIEDSGIGVDPEFLPYMFDRFRQAEQGPNRRFGGLGLGLSIVKELVHLHGASVQARSKGTNQGTTVTMDFPVPAVLDQPDAWQGRSSGIEVTGARLDGVSVLVVDDEPEGLSTVEHILEQHGAAVLRAASVEEALQVLQQHHPALLLADLAMPGRDGLDLVRAVRELDSPLRDTPAAMLSAHLASEFATTSVQAGFQIFIEKPVRPQELVGQIARLAARSSFRAGPIVLRAEPLTPVL